MTKVNEYVLKNWRLYKEETPCFESEEQCLKFLLFLEHFGLTLEEIKENPEVFKDKAYWVYGDINTVKDAIECMEAFTSMVKKEKSLNAYIMEYYMDAYGWEFIENIWESYDSIIKTGWDGDTSFFEVDDYVFHIGLC